MSETEAVRGYWNFFSDVILMIAWGLRYDSQPVNLIGMMIEYYPGRVLNKFIPKFSA